MTYPSLATFVHACTGPGGALQMAIALAQRGDSHLHVMAPGIDHTDPGFYYAGAHAVAIRENAEQARADASALSASVAGRLDGETLRWDLEERVIPAPALPGFVAEQARFCDLFVHEAPYGGRNERDAVTVVEAVLFGARRPLLVVPHDAAPDLAPKRIVVGWNESDEALHAVRGAMPFLRDAELADIVIVDPPRHAAGRTDPGAALASYLYRHGIASEISVLARTEADIADILVRRARETGSDLVVMGAYGHTRMREAIIGGATRNMLERSPLPVLMAH